MTRNLIAFAVVFVVAFALLWPIKAAPSYRQRKGERHE